MAAITDLFSRFGLTAKAKVVVLGSTGASSLNLEHVSPAVMRLEISRDPLAAWRRWFFARKPDAGFILTDFPATLLQAQVFDEWLEARGEALDAVITAEGASSVVVQHYCDLGFEISDLRSQIQATVP
jgi:adenylate kinase